MDLQVSPIPRRGSTTLVDDLDNKGDLLFCSGFEEEAELRSQQYSTAIHMTISSDNLLGHW